MFAVLLLPKFRLQAALRLRSELEKRPVAVFDEETAKGPVIECNSAAEASGVREGMPGVQALARRPDLALMPRARAEEKAAQSALIELAGSLSPDIEATADGCCTVDLRRVKIGHSNILKNVGISGDWQKWSEPILSHLAALRLEGKIGVAPNPDLAFLAARRAEPALVVQSPQTFLAHLAVAEMDPPPHLLAVLSDWGIHTLGQLTSLPRGELASRLGPDADRLWQRASGRSERLLRHVRPREEFAEAFDFDHPIETTEPLLFILRRFLDQLAVRLNRTHKVAAELTLTLPLDSGADWERVFSVPSPAADVEVLFRILHAHLDGLRLEAHPVGVRLRIEPALPAHQQSGLFETALRDPNGFGETLARLNALVGEGSAGVAEIEDTHRPDAFRIVAPQFHDLCGGGGGSAFNCAIGLPLRRYRPPVPATVCMARHRLASIVSGIVRGDVTDALGPYRASGGWWEREQWGVEEWDVEIAGCGLFRLQRCGALKQEQWLIEGCYDAAIH